MRNTIVVINIDETQEPEKWLPAEEGAYRLLFINYSRKLKFFDRLRALAMEQDDVELVDFHKENQGKWKNIYRLYMQDMNYYLLNYNQHWFPDPDLIMEPEDIIAFLNFAHDKALWLSQPAVTGNSFYSHQELVYQAESIMRRTELVEIMCPCFSRDALRKCFWTFDLTHSGYGIDYIWPKYGHTYVVDMFWITHPRPVNFREEAKKRGWPEPTKELKMIREKYAEGEIFE